MSVMMKSIHMVTQLICVTEPDTGVGDVLMYVKDNIKYTTIASMTSSYVESTRINIKHTDESLAVVIMHRPPSANADYFNNMLDQLDHVHSVYDNVILLGDLNHN